jgi:hypothetical protein
MSTSPKNLWLGKVITTNVHKDRKAVLLQGTVGQYATGRTVTVLGDVEGFDACDFFPWPHCSADHM